jgi:uncharacterized protein
LSFNCEREFESAKISVLRGQLFGFSRLRPEEKTFMGLFDDETGFRGAGGTSGGIAEFLIGLAMTVAGAYLLTNQVTVTSSFWTLWGYNTFGVSLLPLIFGVGLLFFNGKSIPGWILLFIGVVVIFTAIIMNLQIYFQQTSLFSTISMLVLLFGGIGLIARGLRSHG